MGRMSEDAGRDSDWFEALFLECGNKVLAYATRRCPGDADDIVAEVFATAWKYRSNVPAEPLPWLYRTAAHQIQHSHRSRSRRAALASRSTQMDEPGRDPTDIADGVIAQVDRETAVARVMADLSPRDRGLTVDLGNDTVRDVCRITAGLIHLRGPGRQGCTPRPAAMAVLDLVSSGAVEPRQGFGGDVRAVLPGGGKDLGNDVVGVAWTTTGRVGQHLVPALEKQRLEPVAVPPRVLAHPPHTFLVPAAPGLLQAGSPSVDQGSSCTACGVTSLAVACSVPHPSPRRSLHDGARPQGSIATWPELHGPDTDPA